MSRLVVTVAEALFEVDDYAPLTVKIMGCAACSHSGRTLLGEPCPRCRGDARIGSSIWRGGSCLARITSAWPENVEAGG